MQVSEAMHAGAESTHPDALVCDVAKKMRDLDIGAVPVCEADHLVGIITDRDITCRVVAEGGDLSKVSVADVMTQNVVYCREHEDLQDAIHIMEDRQIRRMPVVGEEEKMVGMLTLGDISHAAPQSVSGEVMKAVTGHHA